MKKARLVLPGLLIAMASLLLAQDIQAASGTLTSAGPAPRSTITGSEHKGIGSPVRLGGGTIAYAITANLNTGGEELNTFDVTTPGTFQFIADMGSPEYFAGDFAPDGNLYALNYYSNQLASVNIFTGVVTIIGSSLTVNGETWTGLTYDNTTGTWYASSTNIVTSTLYTVDPSTGTTTVVGQLTGSPANIDISADNAGTLYGYDIVNDNFYSVDKSTGATTIIGPIGFDASFAQGMDFDPATNVCYMAAFNVGTFQGELRTVDVSTGNTTLVGAFPSEEVTVVGVSEGSSIPCGDVTGMEARCVGGERGTVHVRVNMSGTTHVGETVVITVDGTPYSSTIIMNGADSYAKFSIPGQSASDHAVSLVSPGGCLADMHAECTGSDGITKDGPEWNDDAVQDIPLSTGLLGNYPNPFNPTTSIQYALSEDARVTIGIYNMLGQLVATLVNANQSAGHHEVVWNGKNETGASVGSGIYIYKMTAGPFTATKRMLLLK